jgi:hypothetical protein
MHELIHVTRFVPHDVLAAFIVVAVDHHARSKIRTEATHQGRQPASCYSTCPGVQELKDLFKLKPGELMSSATQADLSSRHSAQRIRPPGLDGHLAAVALLPNFVGGSAAFVTGSGTCVKDD